MKNEIPNCYDPVVQEERRQAKIDKFLKVLPHCTICESAIFPGTLYREAFRKPVCRFCFEELKNNIEIVPDE